MKTTRLLLTAFIVVLGITLFGCGKKGGDEFIGKWEKVSGSGSNEIVITRNGDGNDFYMISVKPNLSAQSKADATTTERVPATYSDGKLMLLVGMTYVLTIDKASGHLVMPDAEYQRPK
ncbi:hypothetical protein [Robbsia andropogonis]|uniref:hypothetical protein n=1 Tax=Robbsia andropogonis TaxID=28092 RepID=UPI002A6ADC49|nr:hypothetical protein [Robbsia andropogonis]